MNPWLAAGIVAVTLVVTSPFLSEGRHYDARPLFSNSLGDSSEDSSDSLFDPSELPLARNMRPFRMKRMLFDSNCRGIYDQKMMGKLDDVCDSCYNLYRKPYIATECRKYCYNNGVFESCLNDLLMHDVADEYRNMVQFLGKK